MMGIIEQLAVVEASARNEFGVVFAVVCLVGLASILGFAALCAVVRVFTPVVGWMRRHRCDAALVAPFVICMVYVGATKQTTGRVTFPYTDVETRYLVDAGSYVTNDYVHVAFSKSAVVPDSANLYGAVRPVGSTNDEDWVEFLETTFASFHSPSNVAFAGAITNDFQFYTDYTPGPVVHTNGVAVVTWQRDFAGDDQYLATIRTGVYTNGFRVAPNPAITNGPPIVVTVMGSNVEDDDE